MRSLLRSAAAKTTPLCSLVYVVNRVSKDDSQHFVHIPNLLLRLTERGWNVCLVSERGGRGKGEISSIPVTYLSDEASWSRLPALLATLVAARRNHNRLVFVRISKSAALVSGIAGRFLGWKTLFWLCGTVEDFNLSRKGWIGRLEIAFLWVLFRVVDHLVTGPDSMNEYYRRYYGLPHKKVITLYNDVEIQRGRMRLHEVADGPDHPRILMVHRYSPVRETMRWFPLILEMLQLRHKLGKPVRFDIIGGGPELDEMKVAASAHRDLDVHFHGIMPNFKITPFFERADLFIMPSYREGFPRVVVEAMAHALPLVSTDAGGTRDLLGNLQARYCIDRDDAKGFVEAMDHLLDDKELRACLSEENVEQAKRFSTGSVAKQYDEVLRQLLGQR
jgi:glycosyltransferase involved in cell wall biosynthesis